MTVNRTVLLAVVIIAVLPAPADAYVGPGAGLTVIGAALALLVGTFLAILGFVWYPIRRLTRGLAARRVSRRSGRDAVA